MFKSLGGKADAGVKIWWVWNLIPRDWDGVSLTYLMVFSGFAVPGRGILAFEYYCSKSLSIINACFEENVLVGLTISLYSSGSLPYFSASNLAWTSYLATSWFLLLAFIFLCKSSACESLFWVSFTSALTGLSSHCGRTVRSLADLAELSALRYRADAYQDGIESVPRKLLMLLYLC